jgi:hypothetical protein
MMPVAICLLSTCGDARDHGDIRPTGKSTFCHRDGGLSGPGRDIHVDARARAFLDSLGPEQRAATLHSFTRADAVRWSNLPVNAVPRIGIRLTDLDGRQNRLAMEMIQSAISACGQDMMHDIRVADDAIAPIVPMFGWSSRNYFVALLGQPGSGHPWMLKVGGHHLAYNMTFDAPYGSVTPMFFGTEPVSFSFGGQTYEPMRRQSRAMSALAGAVSAFPDARLAGHFTDVVKGVEVTLLPDRPPIGGNDTAFPSPYPTGDRGRGVRYTMLSRAQQALVRDAIASYASLPGQAMARRLVDDYERNDALKETFIGYSGATDLSADGSYVRIDGPRLWMEFVVQPGVAYPQELHYHALWRDKAADYGGQFRQ